MKKVLLDDLWHRKILNSYWLMTLLFYGGQLFFVSSADIMQLSEEWNLILPLTSNLLILCIMVAAEVWVRVFHHYQKMAVVICGFLLSIAFFITIQPTIDGAEIALLLPVIVSMIYLDQKLLYVSSIICMFMYGVIYFSDQSPMLGKPLEEFYSK